MKSKLKEECMDRAGEIQERRVADRRAEQHAPCYYDTDRNKPLPNAASKCATHATIIAAKDGEIAALTAEVTHLAEKVAERDLAVGSSTDWRVYHSALSECAEQLPNMKHGAPLTETTKFLRMYLAHSLQPTARLYTAATSLHDAVNQHVASDDRTSLGAAFEEMDNAMAAALEAGGTVAESELNGGMHASIFVKVWGDAGGGDAGRIALANYAFELGKKAASAAPQPVDAAQAVPETALPILSEERITTIATEIALNVANNASSVPQLCFPHIYLGLKDLFAADPVKPTDTAKGA